MVISEATSKSNWAICTIVSKNYLPYARTLARSFRQYNQGRVFVLLVDRIDGYFKPEEEPFELIEIDALRDMIPDYDQFCFQYTILELNTAVKPFLLEFLFKKYHLDKIIYLDPDILITNNLGELFNLLGPYSIVVTPHLTSPMDDNLNPTELDILKSGTYNLGFIGMSNTPTVLSMLRWWQKRLRDQCIVAFEEGLFVDQRWIDLLPGFMNDVMILRHPGYNVAYWNYHDRKVLMEGDKVYINGGPSYFFHFSGFNPKNLHPVSKHQNRFTLTQLPEMKPLFELYRDKLLSQGWEECKNWPYAFGCFDNGVKIPDFLRRLYLEKGEKVKKFGNPFSTDTENLSFFNWLCEAIDQKSPGMTRLMDDLYKSRPDLQKAFPKPGSLDRERFWLWMTTVEKMAYQLDDRFFEKVKIPHKNRYWKLIPTKVSTFNLLLNSAKSALGSASKRLLGDYHPVVDFFRRLNNRLNSRFKSRTDSVIFKRALPAVSANKEIGVNIAGYIQSEHGVGEAVRANIRAFESAGVPYVLNNLDSSSRQEDDSYTAFSLLNPYDVNFIHINADQVPAFHLQKGEGYFNGKYNIGYWVWELADFPEEWLDRFQYFDEIWTASQFCVDAIGKVSPTPVIRIPHSIHFTNISAKKRSDFGIKEDHFVFLFVFDLLSYFERKNPLALIDAFKMAFQKNEDIHLFLKCSNGKANRQAMQKITDAIRGYPVTLLDSFLSKGDIHALMSLSDCYVSLHRSEGFGLPLAEAMYLKKPVIATAYSGNLDFMNLNNSFLVKYKLVEIEKDVGPYKAGSVWAEPDMGHAAEQMRLVYENRELGRSAGRIASDDIKTRLSPEQVGKRIRERMKIITGMDHHL